MKVKIRADHVGSRRDFAVSGHKTGLIKESEGLLGPGYERFGFPVAQLVKSLPVMWGYPGSVPELGRSPGEGNGNPLHYSCLENSMDRGAWWATLHEVTKNWTRLNDYHFMEGSVHQAPQLVFYSVDYGETMRSDMIRFGFTATLLEASERTERGGRG